MAILEIGMTFEGEPLLECSFYTTNYKINKDIRMSLLQALDSLSTEAFGDEIQSFSLSGFSIVVAKKPLKEPIDQSHVVPLVMYCIIDKESSEKLVKTTMITAIEHFLNKYSLVDIFEKKTKKFKDFDKRIREIFKDLILKNEDRLKSLF
jgi:hypothetical protein